MSAEKDRAELIEWLQWAEIMSIETGRGNYAPRQLLTALIALNEGRSPAILAPAHKSNSTDTSLEQAIKGISVATVDRLVEVGMPLSEALEKVQAIAGTEITADLRKKIKSKKSDKYQGHREHYEKAGLGAILGTAQHGHLPTDKTVLDSLVILIAMCRGVRVE